MNETIATELTPHAQQVLALAQKEAVLLKHRFVGTEHLLLGVLALEQGIACRLGLQVEEARREVKKQIGTGSSSVLVGGLQYTRRANNVLALARKEVEELNHAYVGPAHILLGILREANGNAVRILNERNISIGRVRDAVLEGLDANFAGTNETSVAAVLNRSVSFESELGSMAGRMKNTDAVYVKIGDEKIRVEPTIAACLIVLSQQKHTIKTADLLGLLTSLQQQEKKAA